MTSLLSALWNWNWALSGTSAMSVSAIPVVYGAKVGSYDPLTCILEESNVIKSNIHGTLPRIAATLGGCATWALDDDVAVLH